MSIDVFDSRNLSYRNPFGAVMEGTSIHFRIRLPRYLNCSAARLITHNELTGEEEIQNMFWCGMEGNDNEWWEVDYTPSAASLYFYWFALSTSSGDMFVSRSAGGKGIITTASNAWQLTVYEKDFKTPDWLDGGIMYQIFPDSFCRSDTLHKNVPEERVIMNWDDPVHWWADEDGKITNRHYYAGDLGGICEKLDYLRSMNVSCIYLNPIFEAHENHRYNTADYTKIDPLLGDEQSFKRLCREAGKRGIRVILDGVFSHTGADSVYFNKYGRYKEDGAYNSQQSPYYPWFKFRSWPDDYQSWWGFLSLPELIEETPESLEYFTGDKGIVRRWLDKGASGWRLDVADELPDVFLDSLRRAAKKENPDSIIIGEVWEDASNKIAYSQRRRYLLGKQLDSVMNYCFRDAILGFLTDINAETAMDRIMNVLENYPPQVVRVLMNLLGTHDTERAITVLAGEPTGNNGREWQAAHHLSEEQRRWGIKRYLLAVVLQYTVPGVPSVYYGDEIGMEGYKDPFNRASYPWGREDERVIEWHRAIGALRSSVDCLRGADFTPVWAGDGVMAYLRRGEKNSILVAVNAGGGDKEICLPEMTEEMSCLLGEWDGSERLRVAGSGAVILCSGLTAHDRQVLRSRLTKSAAKMK